MGCESQLDNIFTNVVYIGHWVHQGAIAQFYNHEAIVDEDLFMYAFNAISRVDFYGNANPNYNPHRPVCASSEGQPYRATPDLRWHCLHR